MPGKPDTGIGESGNLAFAALSCHRGLGRKPDEGHDQVELRGLAPYGEGAHVAHHRAIRPDREILDRERRIRSHAALRVDIPRQRVVQSGRDVRVGSRLDTWTVRNGRHRGDRRSDQPGKSHEACAFAAYARMLARTLSPAWSGDAQSRADPFRAPAAFARRQDDRTRAGDTPAAHRPMTSMPVAASTCGSFGEDSAFRVHPVSRSCSLGGGQPLPEELVLTTLRGAAAIRRAAKLDLFRIGMRGAGGGCSRWKARGGGAAWDARVSISSAAC